MSGLVYFAQAASGPVKIGFTTDLDGRMSALRTSSATPIVVLTTVEGDKRTEHYFHGMLEEHRTYGEWFAPVRPVFAAIERVQEWGEARIPLEFRAKPRLLPAAPKSSFDTLAAAKGWIEALAEPVPFGEKTHYTIKRVARLAGASPRNIKSLWYDEKHSVKAEVYIGLKEAFEAKMAIDAARRLRGLDRA